MPMAARGVGVARLNAPRTPPTCRANAPGTHQAFSFFFPSYEASFEADRSITLSPACCNIFARALINPP